MKSGNCKRKVVVAFLIFILLIIAWVITFRMYSYTLTNFNKISVFTPNGMADKYEDITMISPNEDHRIWMYKLNKKEEAEINNELINQPWNPLSYNDYDYVIDTYFKELKFEFNVGDEVYYCLFNCDADDFKFLDKNDGTLLIYQHNVLFVYNKTLGEYYCINKETS